MDTFTDMTRRKKTLPRVIAGATLLGGLLVFGYFVYLQLRPDVPNTSSGFRPLEHGYYSHGIDVSHYQGDIQWKYVFKKSTVNISFVFCKATEGVSIIDDRWLRNRKELLKRNIPMGAYHYFKPNSNPVAQADFFLEHYQARQNDLPPVLDVEEEGNNPISLRNSVKTWLDFVEKETGKRPIIYTNYFLFNSIFKAHFKDYRFWIANYSDQPERLRDERILYWQYTDQGQVPGINGYVDLNMSKVKFE